MSTITFEEAQKNIDSLTEEYNSEIKKLIEEESSLRGKEDSSFDLLKKLYSRHKKAPGDAALAELEQEYLQTQTDIDSLKLECFKIQTRAFRCLQKLRTLELNLLTSVNRDLDSKIKKLEEESPKSDQNSLKTKPVIRADNLSA